MLFDLVKSGISCKSFHALELWETVFLVNFPSLLVQFNSERLACSGHPDYFWITACILIFQSVVVDDYFWLRWRWLFYVFSVPCSGAETVLRTSVPLADEFKLLFNWENSNYNIGSFWSFFDLAHLVALTHCWYLMEWYN